MTDDGILAVLGGFYIFGFIFLLVLAILWFFLPFAIFGTKERLDTLIRETQKTNALLEQSKISARVEPTLASPSFTAVSESPELGRAEPMIRERRDSQTEDVGLSRKELMNKYGISFDGDKYTYKNYHYDVLADAVAYARQQSPDSEAT